MSYDHYFVCSIRLWPPAKDRVIKKRTLKECSGDRTELIDFFFFLQNPNFCSVEGCCVCIHRCVSDDNCHCSSPVDVYWTRSSFVRYFCNPKTAQRIM